MLESKEYNDVFWLVNRMEVWQLRNLLVVVNDNLAVISFPALDTTERLMVRDGLYVEAIKTYRKRNDCSLMLAKDKVEQYRAVFYAEEKKLR